MRWGFSHGLYAQYAVCYRDFSFEGTLGRGHTSFSRCFSSGCLRQQWLKSWQWLCIPWEHVARVRRVAIGPFQWMVRKKSPWNNEAWGWLCHGVCSFICLPPKNYLCWRLPLWSGLRGVVRGRELAFERKAWDITTRQQRLAVFPYWNVFLVYLIIHTQHSEMTEKWTHVALWSSVMRKQARRFTVEVNDTHFKDGDRVHQCVLT